MAKTRVSPALKKAVRRRGAAVAAITAGGVFALLVVQSFVLALLGTLQLLTITVASPESGTSGGLVEPAVGGLDLGAIFASALAQDLELAVPFLIGLFLAIWQLAPITHRLRLAHVITRALLAAGTGALVLAAWAAVLTLLDLLTPWTVASTLTAPGNVIALPYLLLTALMVGVGYAPIVTLAAILSWGWQQRHPLKHELGGMLDDVR